MVVLGASPKPERYSNQAIRLLLELGYRVTPVNPAIRVIEGLNVTHDLADIDEPVHTLTMYLGEARSSKISREIRGLKPQRVIFNPGSESDQLRSAAHWLCCEPGSFNASVAMIRQLPDALFGVLRLNLFRPFQANSAHYARTHVRDQQSRRLFMIYDTACA